VTYTHDGSETTDDSFDFTVEDGTTTLAGDFTFDIAVSPVNEAPTADDDGFLLDEGGTVDVGDLILGDSDPDSSDAIEAIRITNLPINGTLLLSGIEVSNEQVIAVADLGNLTYEHDGSETISDSFTYVANDGELDSNEATVSLTITPVDDTANDDDYIVAQNELQNGQFIVGDPEDLISGVLSNDEIFVPAGATLTVELVSGVNDGTLTLNSNGSFIYAPPSDGSLTGVESFTYRILLDGLEVDTATVTIAVTEGNGTLGEVSVVVETNSVIEGEQGQFILTLQDIAGNITPAYSDTVINYVLSGDAANSGDITTPITGTVTIAAGSTSATLNIVTIDDALVEGNETLTVTLTGADTGEDPATLSVIADDTATLTIVDNSSEPAAASFSTGAFSASALSAANDRIVFETRPANPAAVILAINVAQLLANDEGYAAGSFEITSNADNVVYDETTGDITISSGVSEFTYQLADVDGNLATGTVSLESDDLVDGLLMASEAEEEIFVSNTTADTVSYENTSASGVTVDLTQTTQTGGSSGTNEALNDILVDILNITGTQNDDVILGNDLENVLIGLGGDDELRGMAGADTLDGGAGEDLLDGGPGSDELTGGDGADIFVVRSETLEAADIITDFEDGIDLMALDGGLTFADLTLVPTDTNADNFADATEIQSSGESLVMVLSVLPQELDGSDFVDLNSV